jgi:hypothetical protein
MMTLPFKPLSMTVLAMSLVLALPNPAWSKDRPPPTSSPTSQGAQHARLAPAVLQDLRQRLAGRMSGAQLDALLSRLASMEAREVSELARGPVSRLERLIPGANASPAAAGSGSRATLTGQGVQGASGTRGPASQAGTVGQAPFKGGFTGGRQGQFSDCGQACGSGTQDRNSRDETQDTENLAKEPIDTNKGDSGSGFVIRLYQDGSFTITDKRNGQREVWGKDGHPATSSPKWTSNKTPVPDGEGGSRSGAVTRDEWRTLLGMIGARGGRLEKESGTAAGGIKAPTTTTAGTPVDHDRAVTVDLVQVQEIIRLSVEKLGPKLN